MYRWKYNGTLNKIETDYSKGVYLLIFNGIPKRIIYVGTTGCFIRRMEQHREGYLTGNRTIWNVTKDSDIYELMSCQGSFAKSSRFGYYASLAKKGKLWANTTLEKEEIVNELNVKEDFNIFWKVYVSDFFIKNIEIWTCSMDDNMDRILALESKIQRSFKMNFLIESYINNHGMCFLGKIEFNEDLTNYKFHFFNTPGLDKVSIRLLKELPERRLVNYKKISYSIKQKQKQQKIKKARVENTYAYTKWEKQEDDVLFSCCKLGIGTEIIANIHLQRTLEEVNNRIKYLSKYYDFTKS